ncbi:MAG: hypothetical protein AAF438_12140, partial [Pseudomonadota bacterium]
ERAAEGYVGFHHHNFPECFVCGPERGDDDGLRIFPGAVPSGKAVAAPWIPSESLTDSASGTVAPEFVWAALDCPGYFGLMSTEFSALLGRMTAHIRQLPEVNQSYVVMGWPIDEEGRKLHVGSAVFSGDGELFASARATWIRVDPTKYNQ